MTAPSLEVNFDGLVGPTHNYAGLSTGNVASTANAQAVSHPKAAALQGLAKMKALMALGLPQGVLPPHERPDVGTLRRLGFRGRDAEVLRAARHHSPALFHACCSASAMWTANAATVSPSADTQDHRVHFTPANLVDRFHRSLEPATTARVLKAIFADETQFVHHEPLPFGQHFADEGAANHTRLVPPGHGAGVALFVYGRSAFDEGAPKPAHYPARQTLEASRAIARCHRLDPGKTVFAQQHWEAIDAGVFHNDVIAVGHGALLFYHEAAFAAEGDVLEGLNRALDGALVPLRVAAAEVSLKDAVASYLFNSQLVTLPDGTVALVAPGECREIASVAQFLARIVGPGGPIHQVHYFDLRESMKNGGGPACLRLRVVLTERELARVNPGVRLTPALHRRLEEWVQRHYRDRLSPADLVDPALLDESRTALDELTTLLRLGTLYPFQR